jgi:hypothetical protein
MNPNETQSSGSLERVVSVRFGELHFCGCDKHRGRFDLSCAGIRQVGGRRLSIEEVWEVLKEQHANPKVSGS